jgi:hypothetical protein
MVQIAVVLLAEQLEHVNAATADKVMLCMSNVVGSSVVRICPYYLRHRFVLMLHPC